jgi:DNA integrity scanning protein DisA with diadenylate cyclase activity
LGEGADFARGLDETERQREFLFFPSFACKEKETKKTGNLIIVTNMQSSEPLTTALQL